MLETARIVNKSLVRYKQPETFKMFQQQGAALQSYNNELIKCIDELCAKRDDLQKQIKEEEEEKNKIQNDIQILAEKLAKINESLAKKIATRNDYDKTISETEAAYVKIIDSSHTLLNTLQKEASVLKDKGVPGFSNVQTS